MTQHLARIGLAVADHDEAIAWYTQKLGFTLVEDSVQEGGRRWVVIAPPGSRETALVLQKATTDRQKAAVGNQAGGRVFLFLHTDDFARDHAACVARGVAFAEPPRREAHGTVAIFSDLYGNRWELIEPVR